MALHGFAKCLVPAKGSTDDVALLLKVNVAILLFFHFKVSVLELFAYLIF